MGADQPDPALLRPSLFAHVDPVVVARATVEVVVAPNERSIEDETVLRLGARREPGRHLSPLALVQRAVVPRVEAQRGSERRREQHGGQNSTGQAGEETAEQKEERGRRDDQVAVRVYVDRKRRKREGDEGRQYQPQREQEPTRPPSLRTLPRFAPVVRLFLRPGRTAAAPAESAPAKATPTAAPAKAAPAAAPAKAAPAAAPGIGDRSEGQRQQEEVPRHCGPRNQEAPGRSVERDPDEERAPQHVATRLPDPELAAPHRVRLREQGGEPGDQEHCHGQLRAKPGDEACRRALAGLARPATPQVAGDPPQILHGDQKDSEVVGVEQRRRRQYVVEPAATATRAAPFAPFAGFAPFARLPLAEGIHRENG